MQIFFLFYGLPRLLEHRDRGIHRRSRRLALPVTIWGGAFNTENFRAGFEAVPLRYREAGLALGFGRLATFFRVTLPIGGRIALPSTINTYVSVLKNTSLLTAIGFQELTTTARSISAQNFRDVEMLATVGVTYLALVWTLSGLIRLLERRLAFRRHDRSRASGTASSAWRCSPSSLAIAIPWFVALVPDAAGVVGSRAALHDPHGAEGDAADGGALRASARR